MKRAIVAVLLVVGLTVVAVPRSRAQTVVQMNGYCFSAPFNTLVPCDATTPAPVVSTPMKTLSVSPPTVEPNGITSYLVGIQSHISCFALPEPTLLYALSNPGSAFFTELFPVPGGAFGQAVSVLVDQHAGPPPAGSAQLSLEVSPAAVGPGGLDVKAVWPSENVERVVNLIPPATPTPTTTAGPGTPILMATATPTATPTSTPVGSPTATQTATSSPTPVPRPFTVQACVQPPIMSGQTLGGDFPVLNGLTSPGAVCTAAVVYLDGTSPSDLNTMPATAGSDGLVSFGWTEGTTAGGGIGGLRCTLNGATQQACAGFLVLQQSDSGLTQQQQQDLLAQIQSLAETDCGTLFP